MEDKKVMKNMEYWRKKNNIPGIEALKDSGLTDGRAGSSPFQLNPVMPNIRNITDEVKKPQPLNVNGGVGNTSDALSAKIDEKIDEKVDAAVSGDSAVAMKSPVKKKGGPETKQINIDDVIDADDLDGEKQEASAQEFENIKNDHDVDDDGIPQTDPEGYWKKAAKHGIYPKGKSPSKIYSKSGKRRKNYKY
jgi:hypothetical protein